MRIKMLKTNLIIQMKHQKMMKIIGEINIKKGKEL